MKERMRKREKNASGLISSGRMVLSSTKMRTYQQTDSVNAPEVSGIFQGLFRVRREIEGRGALLELALRDRVML